MKITTLQSVKHQKVLHLPGTTLEVDEKLGQKLIDSGAAELAATDAVPVEPPETPTPSTPAPAAPTVPPPTPPEPKKK